MKKRSSLLIIVILAALIVPITQRLVGADVMAASKQGTQQLLTPQEPTLAALNSSDIKTEKKLNAYFSSDDAQGCSYIHLRSDESFPGNLTTISIPLRTSKKVITDKASVKVVIRFAVEGRKNQAGIIRNLSVKAPGETLTLTRSQIGLNDKELSTVRLISVESYKDQEGHLINSDPEYKVYINPNSQIRLNSGAGLGTQENKKPKKGQIVNLGNKIDSSGPALSLNMRLNLQTTQHNGLIHVLMGHEFWVTTVGFSPDGKTLASGSADTYVNFWDMNTGKLASFLSGTHDGSINSLMYSPDGKTLFTTSDDATIKLWDVDEQIFIKAFRGHAGAITAFDLSPDGKIFATGSADHTLRFWDVEKGSVYSISQSQSTWVTSVAFSADGKTLAAGYWDSTIRIWDVKTGKSLQTLTAHHKAVSSLAFSPDGRYLASGSYDCTVKIWDAQDSYKLKHVFMGSFENMFKTWDPRSGFLRHIMKSAAGHKETVTALAFAPNSQILASGSNDTTINLYDIENKEILTTINAHRKSVKAIKFSPDGKLLASGSMDRTVKVWDVEHILNSLKKTTKK